MSKKKFKETKVGKFLVGEKGLFTNLADVVPDKGFLGLLKNLILKDDNIPLQDKETALQLLKMDEIELLEVTNS